MKSIAVEGRTLTVKKLMKMAKSEPVVLTQRGQPVCAVVEVDDLDLEAWSLGNNPQFLALLERSRERLRKEGGIPLDEVRRRLGLNGKRRSRRAAKK
jgi:PHD/YefM family antitoxin component YafN of YafNO toxin-antitoxin module